MVLFLAKYLIITKSNINGIRCVIKLLRDKYLCLSILKLFNILPKNILYLFSDSDLSKIDFLLKLLKNNELKNR